MCATYLILRGYLPTNHLRPVPTGDTQTLTPIAPTRRVICQARAKMMRRCRRPLKTRRLEDDTAAWHGMAAAVRTKESCRLPSLHLRQRRAE